ncbi:MAG: single-stranded-DNA-specific exonuclease RecJ [Cytophagales bacterium]|nr:MAG: single-stranded-DNA-specific exonuclease RecJ [Cytophagales bacterium]TAF60477.1 MAG: single-stranded-DNA-specific exonuclease RecJ [Cytophagales bacterium]
MQHSSSVQWRYKKIPDASRIEELSAALNTGRVTSALLLQRGIDSFEAAKSFFTPSKAHLLSPWLLKDMPIAINRIEEALIKKQKIVIIGDYDVDGTTSTAFVYGVLKDLGAQVMAYQPQRLTEGYGISLKAIQEAHQQQTSLIISLDCGMSAADMVQEAKRLGMDFIVVDHHLPSATALPQAIIINPKQADCPYPFKELSGCGLAFKLMQALSEQMGLDSFLIEDRLDLVALSIAADIVSLTGENRTLCALGLEKLAQRPNLGIKSLMKSAGQGKAIAVSDLVFKVSPLINAPGRMGSASVALHLLLAKSTEEAEAYAQRIFTINQLRRNTERNVCEEAFTQAQTLFAHSPALVLFDKSWHKGVLGIAASRCVDRFRKPTIVLSGEGETVVGSGRTLANLPLYDSIKTCSNYLRGFGGHAFAAGVQLREHDVEAFRGAFIEAIRQTEAFQDLVKPFLDIDLAVTAEELKPRTVAVINRMGPFGPDLMRPVLSCVVQKPLDVAVFRGQHLWLKLKLGNDVFEAVGFQMANMAGIVSQGAFEMAFSISEKINTQLDLKGLRPCNP